MLTIKLNSKNINLPKTMKLTEALNFLGYTDENFAVAVNKNFVPKSLYPTISLIENDELDIVSPMCGG